MSSITSFGLIANADSALGVCRRRPHNLRNKKYTLDRAGRSCLWTEQSVAGSQWVTWLLDRPTVLRVTSFGQRLGVRFPK